MNLAKLSIITIFIFCFSCKFKAAPIENHARDIYTKHRKYNANKYSSFAKKSRQENNSSQITITSGDTLYGIAKEYNVNIRDLIKANNLRAPYVLVTGSKMKIPQASYYKVQSGDTLYGISRDHNINVNEIVNLNDLKAPYNLYAGQKIKISNKNSRLRIAKTKPKTNAYSPKKSNFVSRILPNKNNRFKLPVSGKIISNFGPKSGGLYNDGINIKAAKNSSVKSAEDGIVAYVGNELKGYGNLVILKHSGGWVSAYGHLNETKVKRGQKVAKSQIIASVGSTGNVDSAQLYFGLRKGREAVNPEFYLKN